MVGSTPFQSFSPRMRWRKNASTTFSSHHIVCSLPGNSNQSHFRDDFPLDQLGGLNWRDFRWALRNYLSIHPSIHKHEWMINLYIFVFIYIYIYTNKSLDLVRSGSASWRLLADPLSNADWPRGGRDRTNLTTVTVVKKTSLKSTWVNY